LKQGAHVKVWSRRAADFTDRFSRIAEAVRGLPVDEAMIDGEAVVFQDDGRSDFRALLTKRGWEQAALVAFDLLRLDGEDLRQRPLEKRREALMWLVAKRRGDGVVLATPSRPRARSCSPRHANLASKASCRSGRAASIRAGRAGTG
jgi:ATP-dependent DNA ligase